MMRLGHQKIDAETRKFYANAEIDGILVNEVNAKNDEEKAAFARRREEPQRKVDKAAREIARLDIELMKLREAQTLDDHWWGKALPPILIGLLIAVPGFFLISKSKRRQTELGSGNER